MLLMLLIVFGVLEFWLVAWSVRLIKRRRPISLALGILLAFSAIVWPLALFGGVAAVVAGSITVAR